MPTRALSRPAMSVPSIFNEFFKPWNEWFDDSGAVNRISTIPAVNITDNKDSYAVSLAAPGLKKEDFKIDIDGNMLNISAEKEEQKEQNEERFTRREYNYTSFSRSFTLPEDVNKEAIDARYENGVLQLMLPKREETKKAATKQISVK